ncbi:MBOAT family protein [bacterium]|nr:MBOAT family protein [bacterium]
MLFNSLDYFLFLLFVLPTFFFLQKNEFRNVFLLLVSYFFYGCWKPEYLALILFSTGIDYFSAIKMETAKSKKLWLSFSLISNFGLLFSFKYFNFFVENINHFTTDNFNTLDILLPVGISFYTFQTLSYTFDVYFGKLKAERNFVTFALYVSFFPQLVAGPIERATHLLPQFKEKKVFVPERAVEGAKRIFWGLFKKVVIADNLALIVDKIFGNLASASSLEVLLAVYFFAFQIYCDFSGYSDIAIGSAKILGFDLMENFKRPYFAVSIPDFWKRWHISLSTWFKDYLYLPLGGNRKGEKKTVFNQLTVFILSGFWHGANWTFVFWGFLHGVFNSATRLVKIRKNSQKSLLQTFFSIFFTFQLVSFAWIFFRAKDLEQVFFVLEKISCGFSFSQVSELKKMFFGGISLIAFLWFLEFLQEFEIVNLEQKPLVLRWSFYFLIFFAILVFGKTQSSQFIYFQF